MNFKGILFLTVLFGIFSSINVLAAFTGVHPTIHHGKNAAHGFCVARNGRGSGYKDFKCIKRCGRFSPTKLFSWNCKPRVSDSNGAGNGMKCKVHYGDPKTGRYKQKTLSKRPVPYKCNSSLFGGDPASGVKKSCFIGKKFMALEGKRFLIGANCPSGSPPTGSSGGSGSNGSGGSGPVPPQPNVNVNVECKKYHDGAVKAQQDNLALKCGYKTSEWSLKGHDKWCKGQYKKYGVLKTNKKIRVTNSARDTKLTTCRNKIKKDKKNAKICKDARAEFQKQAKLIQGRKDGKFAPLTWAIKALEKELKKTVKAGCK